MASIETTGTAPSPRTRAVVYGVIGMMVAVGLILGWGHPVLRGFMFGMMWMLLPVAWTEAGLLRKRHRTGRHNA